jgi:hypothetical protein
MPIVPEIQDRLLLAFPKSSYVGLYRAVQEGSFAAFHLIDGDRFLSGDLGRDLIGHVRRVCISHQINEYCDRGDLPFVTEIKRMPKGPLHWLEIGSTGAVAHVCRVPDEPFAFPDEAESRQDYRLSLQTDLESWLSTGETESLGKIIRMIPRLYAWLTFHAGNKGQIKRLSFGSPASDVNDWIGYINILDEIEKSGADLPDVPSVPEAKVALRLRDEVVAKLEEDKKSPEDKKIDG